MTAAECSFDKLKNVWAGMFCEPVVSACIGEENEQIMKMSMLLKTVFYLHKNLVYGSKKAIDEARAVASEKENIISELQNEVLRLKSNDQYLNHQKPMKDTTMLCAATPSPPIKRVSVEGDTSYESEENELKKIKIDSEPKTPTKTISREVLVPETFPFDTDDACTILNQGIIIPESVDISSDGLYNLEQSPVLQTEESPNNHKLSPVKPKSPILLIARAKKYSFLQVPFPCLDSSISKISPDKSLKSESKKVTSFSNVDSPPKIISTESKIASPLQCNTKQAQVYADRNLSPSPTKWYDTRKLKSPESPDKTKYGKENKIKDKKEFKLPSTSRIRSNNVNGVKKIKDLTPEKNLKPVKMKQTKLSLSMFQAKKSLNIENPIVNEDDELLQMALKESLKSANKHDAQRIIISPDKCLNQTFKPESIMTSDEFALVPERQIIKTVKPGLITKRYEIAPTPNRPIHSTIRLESVAEDNEIVPPPDRNVNNTFKPESFDTAKTYFNGTDVSLLENAAESSVLQKTVDPNKTYFEESVDRQNCEDHTGMHSPQQTIDPDRTYFEEAKSILFHGKTPEKKSGLPEVINKEVIIETGPSRLKTLSSLDEKYLQDYNKVHVKDKNDVGFVYKSAPVRKKDERQQLPGWECHECKVFFELHCKNLTSQERQQIVSKCSRHRQAVPYIANTPPGIWEIAPLHTPVGCTQEGKLKQKQTGIRIIDKAVEVPESVESNMM